MQKTRLYLRFKESKVTKSGEITGHMQNGTTDDARPEGTMSVPEAS